MSRDYPRLPICLQGDALYAVEPIMKLCREHGWKYILTQKATRQKVLAESYEWIARGGGAERVEGIGKEKGNINSSSNFSRKLEKIIHRTNTAIK